MYEIKNNNNEAVAKIWTQPEKIESSAMQQIYNMAKHPHLYKWVAIMPDVHTGIGATIGAVIPMDGVLIPAAVGVDIGCGMCSVKTNLKVEEIKRNQEVIHQKIIDRIPLGFNHRVSRQMNDVSRFADKMILERASEYKDIEKNPIPPQLGTLGGGNHFIELQKDADDWVWIMLHSGSRNIGNVLANHHIRKARKLTETYKIHVPKGLDSLPEDSPEGKTYIKDMEFAMEFARQNRFVMIEVIKEILSELYKNIEFEETINIHHNYAAKENHYGKKVWIHRKGATKVRDNITGIIPGSMGNPSFIVKGTNDNESFFSCSHGAGRTMSRKAAKKILDMGNFKKQMEEIYSESIDTHHLDEAPDAYKDIKEVINNQKNLINVEVKLIPILNIKG